MVLEVKNFLIDELGRSSSFSPTTLCLIKYLSESQNIFLETKRGVLTLPWTTLPYTLNENHLELVNWPVEVPIPGTGENDQKGINGINTANLKRLWLAVKNEDPSKRLGFRRTRTHTAAPGPSSSAETPADMLERCQNGTALYRMAGPADDSTPAPVHGAGPPGESIIVFRHAKRKRSDDGRGEGPAEKIRKT
jgi:hypothetical protein